MDDNIIMLTDGYKPSHWKMDPPGTEFKHFYFESRGGEFKDVVFFGLQPRLQKLARRVHALEVAEANHFYDKYFGRTDVFNARGWYHRYARVSLAARVGRLSCAWTRVTQSTKSWAR